jgi:hypothetical protein
MMENRLAVRDASNEIWIPKEIPCSLMFGIGRKLFDRLEEN